MRNDRGHSEEVELCVKILSDIMEWCLVVI
jgi:hypothetical protein